MAVLQQRSVRRRSPDDQSTRSRSFFLYGSDQPTSRNISRWNLFFRESSGCSAVRESSQCQRLVAASFQCISSCWKERVSQHPLLRRSYLGFNPPSRYQTELWMIYDGADSLHGRQDPPIEGDFLKVVHWTALWYEHLPALGKS